MGRAERYARAPIAVPGLLEIRNTLKAAGAWGTISARPGKPRQTNQWVVDPRPPAVIQELADVNLRHQSEPYRGQEQPPQQSAEPGPQAPLGRRQGWQIQVGRLNNADHECVALWLTHPDRCRAAHSSVGIDACQQDAQHYERNQNVDADPEVKGSYERVNFSLMQRCKVRPDLLDEDGRTGCSKNGQAAITLSNAKAT